ncbi:MAG: S1C family serine protease [Pirellulaceae bacterium]
MTRPMPGPSREQVAVAHATPTPIHRLRIVLLTAFVLMVVWVLLGGFAAAQTDSDVSTGNETEVSETAGEENQTVGAFDFFGNKSPASIEQLREMQEHFRELSEDVADATVSVQVGQNQGTGVIVTRDGYVMTAAHVIGGADRDATIRLPDGTQLDAKTLGLNRTIDSGLLKITEKGKYPYLSPGISEDLKTGQWVMAIGHPGGWDDDRGLVFRIGRILRLNDSAISSDCSLVGGDSGGPLVDMDGSVIGIHSRIGASLTTNIHVPVDVFTEQWDDLASGRDWGRGIGGSNPANEPWLGLSLVDGEMKIETIVPDGPAESAGLKEGDLITEFDGQRITNVFRFSRIFRNSEPGDVVKITVDRDGEEVEVELTIGSQDDRN